MFHGLKGPKISLLENVKDEENNRGFEINHREHL